MLCCPFGTSSKLFNITRWVNGATSWWGWNSSCSLIDKFRTSCAPFEVGFSVFFVSDGLRPSITMQCDDSVVMGINGMDYQTTDLDNLADHWQSYKVFPKLPTWKICWFGNYLMQKSNLSGHNLGAMGTSCSLQTGYNIFPSYAHQPGNTLIRFFN